MTDDTRPQIVVTISAPVDEVWDALRSRDKIRHWMGWEYDGLDGEIDLIFFTDTVEDSSARTLTLHGGDEFRLEPDGAGTRVTLTRAAHGDNPDWDAYYDDITEGWVTFLQQLRFAVERHPGAARRTLSFVGGNDNSVHLPDALDLADLVAGAPFRKNLLGQDVARGAVVPLRPAARHQRRRLGRRAPRRVQCRALTEEAERRGDGDPDDVRPRRLRAGRARSPLAVLVDGALSRR